MIAHLAGWLVVAGLFLLAAWFLLQPWLRRRRLAQVGAQPLSRAQQRLIARSVFCFSDLTADQRRYLHRQVQIFLHEKRFHGCDGFVVDDRVRFCIAANACLLCLQPDADCFPALRHILVYPTAFWVHHAQPDELGLVDETPDLLSGEAWDAGRVILSWEDCEAAMQGGSGNVIVHEFAHQLDFEASGADGAPPLDDYSDWARVFQREFERLCQQGSPVLDDYGSTNPAEFFAVATEAFFMRSRELRQAHAELHALLSQYFSSQPRPSA